MITNLTPMQERAADTARLLRALGNTHRLLILCRLLQVGEASAGDLARHLGLGQSALSQHLSRMREEGLVGYRRQARTLIYRIGDIHGGRLPALLQGICDDAGTAPRDDATSRANRTLAVLGLAFGGSAVTAGDGFWQNPAITHAGHVHPLPQAAYQPDRNATCKVVFGMTRGSDEAANVNPALQRVARTVNLYAGAGVPLEQLKFAAVASGAASAMALDDTHYRAQFGIDNPNLPVIRELRESGIDVAVCGQAVVEHHYAYDWISPDVTVALSALTTITGLQQQGYALVPL